MLIRLTMTAACVLGLAACATANKMTIADSLENLGLSRDRSVCMANELEDRLNDKQLGRFARFTRQLDTAETQLQALASLREIEDPQIVKALTGASFSCALQ